MRRPDQRDYRVGTRPMTAATTPTFGYARPGDLRECYQCDLQGYDIAWSEQTWTRCLADKSASTFTVRVGGKVVGWVTGSRGVSASGGKFFDLHKITILPQHRRSGLCRRLVEGLGRGELRTTLKESNLVGLLVAKRLGFKAVRVLKNAFDSEDGVLLVREALT